MKTFTLLTFILALSFSNAQSNFCAFDQVSNNKSILKNEQIIKDALKIIPFKSSHDSIKTIPVIVHIIHNGGSENISDAQVESQILVLNEDFRKIAGTNGDGIGVDTKIQFRLAKIDPNGNCTNGIVRIKSDLTNHETFERSLLKELSFWDNTRYMNIYIVKTISGTIGGYSSFAGGPPDEDGLVVRANLFGTMGTAPGVGRVTTHEIGHWLGIYHTFNNSCGIDVCTDGDYVCDTPPQDLPNYSCSNQNTCSNDVPDIGDMKENYMNYTPGSCQNAFTQGQKDRAQASLETLRPVIWSYSNLISTGCDSNYVAPATCPVIADFVSLTTELCTGNSVYFIDKSLNNATSWQWTFTGGIPSNSTAQNPTVVYSNNGSFKVKLVATNTNSSDTKEITDYIIVSSPGTGDSLSYKQDFELGVDPPVALTINNPDNGITWHLDSMASFTGQYSIKINNLINTNYGSFDEIILPEYDFTTAHQDSNIFMTINWAYAKSDPTYSDEMIVLLSTDCGVNFTQILYKNQNTLATAPVHTTEFVPDSTQWKSETIDLNAYRNETFVQIKIVNVTDGGNCLYLDDIYVGDGQKAKVLVLPEPEPNAISLVENNRFLIFPNPVSDGFQIVFKDNEINKSTISILNAQGKIVAYYDFEDAKNSIFIETKNFEKGMYFVNIQNKLYNATTKIIVE